MIVLATTCSLRTGILGVASVVVPGQRGTIAAAVGAVAQVLAHLWDVLSWVRVGSADPDDCSWTWGVGSLSNDLRTRNGRSGSKAYEQDGKLDERVHGEAMSSM